ncbi:MAG: tetratricopeptide repeat protein [Burkholderiaceae bacterium]
MIFHHTTRSKPAACLFAAALLVTPLHLWAASASPGADTLREGVSAYQKGNFRLAESKLSESLRQGLTQLEEVQQAHKTQGFIYCSTKRSMECEEAFQEALSLDPSYELTASERKNKLWASTFAKVKQRMRKS